MDAVMAQIDNMKVGPQTSVTKYLYLSTSFPVQKAKEKDIAEV